MHLVVAVRGAHVAHLYCARVIALVCHRIMASGSSEQYNLQDISALKVAVDRLSACLPAHKTATLQQVAQACRDPSVPKNLAFWSTNVLTLLSPSSLLDAVVRCPCVCVRFQSVRKLRAARHGPVLSQTCHRTASRTSYIVLYRTYACSRR